MEIGDNLLSLGGIYGEVESILIEERTQTMYDLTVEEVNIDWQQAHLWGIVGV